MATTQQTTTVATLTAGPFGVLQAVTPQPGDPAAAAFVAAGTAATLVAGSYAGSAPPSGLNVAGVASVVSALATYYAALSAAKRAQLGYLAVNVSQEGLSVPVHTADVATLAATLAAVLNTGTNYGPVGT
jgi:hypothetical protein